MSYFRKYLKYKNKYINLKGGSSFTNQYIDWKTYKLFKHRFVIDDGYINSSGEKIYILNSWIDFLVNVTKNKIPDENDINFILQKFFNNDYSKLYEEFIKYNISVKFIPHYEFKIIEKLEKLEKLELYLSTHNINLNDNIPDILKLKGRISIFNNFYDLTKWNDLIQLKVPEYDQEHICTEIKTYFETIQLLPATQLPLAQDFKFNTDLFNNDNIINLIDFKKGYTLDRYFTLPLSFYIHDNKHNRFYAIYEYNSKIGDIYDIKNKLLELCINLKKEKINMYTKFWKETSNDQNQQIINDKVNVSMKNHLFYDNYIAKMNDSKFWESNKYFIIGQINYIYTELKDIYSFFMNKGEGNIMICKFLNLFENEPNRQFVLEPANPKLRAYYENKIGFTCEGTKCIASVQKIINKCREDNKLSEDIPIHQIY